MHVVVGDRGIHGQKHEALRHAFGVGHIRV
jgi:hypothetical protein